MASAPQSSAEPELPPHSDNADEELGRIRLALDTIYAVSSASSQQQQVDNNLFLQRQYANRYLTSFQTTAVSWVVCDRLLWETGEPASSTATINPNEAIKLQQRQFFAAQTLHTKCRSDQDVQQLLQQQQPQQPNPAGNQNAPDYRNSPVLQSLRDSLLQHLNRSVAASTTNGANSALTTRLAMCVSALAVQMQWTTILHDLLQSQQQQGNAPALAPQSILAVLRALPEECASDRLFLVNEDFRFEMRDHLIDSSAAVFAFFMHHLSQQQQPTQQQLYTLGVLQAWHAWIRYVPVRPHSIAESPILPATVNTLVQAAAPNNNLSPDIVENAADSVVEILRMYPSSFNNEVLVHQMLTLLSNLPLQQVLSQSTAASGDNENLVGDYCRIVTEMGESYMSWILHGATSSNNEQQEGAFRLVDWVLLCSSSIADYEIAGITLHFWYRMVMELERTEPMQWKYEIVDLYASRMLQFVSVCATNMMKFPADIVDAPEDQMDEINRHRYHVGEAVEDICRLLGGHVVLQRIAELLHQKVQETSLATLVTGDWQGLESCLSCLVAVHMFVADDENQVLPFCFEQLIPALSNSAVAPPKPLRFTICKVIGKFARWLSQQARSKPQLMPPLLPFLAQSLSIAECAPAASVAIKELCFNLHPESFAIAQPVLELYEQVVASVLASDSSQSSGSSSTSLSLREELEVLEGACFALSRHAQMEPNGNEAMAAFLQRLVTPIGNRLANLVNSPTATPRTTLPEIQRLAVIVQHLKMTWNGEDPESHPIVQLMQSLWVYLETMIARFPSDVNTAEQICRLHKHALRSCGARVYVPVVQKLMMHLVEGYNRSHQSPFLYAGSIVVTEYGGARVETYPPTLQQDLFEMVAAMSATTFSFVASVQDFNNYPDVVEELFYLMERMISHCPDAFVASPLLQQMVQAAIVSMNVDHHGAHKGTLKFLDSLVSYTMTLPGNSPQSQQQQAMLDQTLTQEGGALVQNLVRSLMGELPSYSPKILEILWKLNKLYSNNPSVLTQWIAASLVGHPGLSEGAKNEFLGAMVGTDLARDEFSLAVRSFQNASARQRRHLHATSQS